MNIFNPYFSRQYDPITLTILGAVAGGGLWAGAASAMDRDILTGEPKNTKKNKMQADQQAAESKAMAEQKALQDQQTEKSNRAAMRLSASSSGFSGGSNTARSFLTTF